MTDLVELPAVPSDFLDDGAGHSCDEPDRMFAGHGLADVDQAPAGNTSDGESMGEKERLRRVFL